MTATVVAVTAATAGAVAINEACKASDCGQKIADAFAAASDQVKTNLLITYAVTSAIYKTCTTESTKLQDLPYYNSQGNKEHTKGKRNSTKGKHENGRARNKRDRGGEKGDARRPYRR